MDVFSVDARDAEIIGSSRLFSDGLDDDVGRWWVFSELSRGGGHAHKLFQLLVKLPAVERHENFVNECYRAFLQRLADPGGLSLYSRQLIEKRMSGRDLINIILKSAEGVAVNRRFIVIQHPNRLLNDFVASNHARKILMLNVS